MYSKAVSKYTWKTEYRCKRKGMKNEADTFIERFNKIDALEVFEGPKKEKRKIARHK